MPRRVLRLESSSGHVPRLVSLALARPPQTWLAWGGLFGLGLVSGRGFGRGFGCYSYSRRPECVSRDGYSYSQRPESVSREGYSYSRRPESMSREGYSYSQRPESVSRDDYSYSQRLESMCSLTRLCSTKKPRHISIASLLRAKLPYSYNMKEWTLPHPFQLYLNLN